MWSEPRRNCSLCSWCSLKTLIQAVESYSERVKSFFASMPAAELVHSLPGGKSGMIRTDALG